MVLLHNFQLTAQTFALQVLCSTNLKSMLFIFPDFRLTKCYQPKYAPPYPLQKGFFSCLCAFSDKITLPVNFFSIDLQGKLGDQSKLSYYCNVNSWKNCIS